ncbi:acyl-CoA dehydrogenase [Bordetella ansorpii]|uniref:Acyl-CoA dehydrogenase n=1 Tax=Bordetella ansorpii TaxID=288768 RepID=A0A157RJE9_9BORD|nr:acyl-CoA dehydrogenase [Bordetella ansorpii]SAI58137.1 acyl-CoA dehydrogenase [Bordetella ansorpii]
MDDLFGDAAQRLFAQAYAPDVQRAIERGEGAAQAWQALEESGFLDALVPEQAGGAGLRLCDTLPLAQAAGWHGMGVPFVQTMLARAWLHAAGHAAPAGPIALAPFGAARDANGLVAPAVWAGGAAQWVLVALADGALLLPAEAAQRVPSGGHGSLDADMVWPVQATADAAPLAGTSLAELAAAAAAPLLAGALERVLRMTVDYANDRSQFGKPIGRFQAVQQQLSIMAEQVWAARMAAQLAFQSADTAPQPLLAALGKARTSAAATTVADIAHAVHGAIGVTEEYALQRYTRRLREWRRAAGAETYWHGRIGAVALAAQGESALSFLRTDLYAKID